MSVSGIFCHLRTYLAYFATYERIWHFLPLTNVSGIFCHLHERIWHILPLTNVSGIFCHLQTHLAFFATYMYETYIAFFATYLSRTTERRSESYGSQLFPHPGSLNVIYFYRSFSCYRSFNHR